MEDYGPYLQDIKVPKALNEARDRSRSKASIQRLVWRHSAHIYQEKFRYGFRKTQNDN